MIDLVNLNPINLIRLVQLLNRIQHGGSSGSLKDFFKQTLFMTYRTEREVVSSPRRKLSGIVGRILKTFPPASPAPDRTEPGGPSEKLFRNLPAGPPLFRPASVRDSRAVSPHRESCANASS